MDILLLSKKKVECHSNNCGDKNARKHVDEIDTWAQFHQCSMYSFYARSSPKRKKILLSHKYLFTLSRSTCVKAVRRKLMKLIPGLFNVK
jgi:hypothetical protein